MQSIVVNFNGGDYIVDAVRSLLAQDHPNDVLVIDNGSTDGSDERVRKIPGVEVIASATNLGTAGGFNAVLTRPAFDYYFFFNPDAFAGPNTLGTLVDLMERRPALGVLGPTIVEYHDPSLVQEFAPQLDPVLFVVDRYARKRTSALPDLDYVDASYACGAAFLARGTAFRQVDGCDADFFMFTEEPDLCWRLMLRSWEVAVTPRACVRHVGGLTASAGFRDDGYVTSGRRIYLRERNSLYMGLKNYPLILLAPYVLLDLALLVLEALAMRIAGIPDVTRAYLDAIHDVWRDRHRLLAKRRAIQATRSTSHRIVLRNRYIGYGKLRAFLRRGVPKLVPFTPPTMRS